MLKLNLQFFAKDGPGGEKTEPATSKKLTDARKKGQVAKSKEIAVGFGLLTLFLTIKFVVGLTGTGLVNVFSLLYRKIPDLTRSVSGYVPDREITTAVGQIFWSTIKICLPYMLVGVVVAFVCDLYQVKWVFSWEPFKPNFSKFNPINGIKKIFSTNSLMELLKSFLKIGLIVWLAYDTFKDDWTQLFLLYDMPMMQAVAWTGNTMINFGIKLSLLYLLISALDLIYQRHKFAEDMKMSKQEVKDEYKNLEGDPAVKSKIRQKMREASRRRMMAAVPQADVVITNPTHYAVAIRYDITKAPSPVVVAKGEGPLAARIKEIAKENDVEIVENKPLARMLYLNVDIDEQIPQELYQAVAEVLAYVYKLKGKV